MFAYLFLFCFFVATHSFQIEELSPKNYTTDEQLTNELATEQPPAILQLERTEAKNDTSIKSVENKNSSKNENEVISVKTPANCKNITEDILDSLENKFDNQFLMLKELLEKRLDALQLMNTDLKVGQNSLLRDVQDAKSTSKENQKRLDNVVQTLSDYIPQQISLFGNITLKNQKKHCQVQWIDTDHYKIPDNAVLGYVHKKANQKAYSHFVGRVAYDGELVPGYAIPQAEGIYFVYKDGWRHATYYQVLTGCQVKWVNTSGNNIPENAIVGGYTKSGETLYICRAPFEDIKALGKVQPSQGKCYIPYHTLHERTEYEILTVIN